MIIVSCCKQHFQKNSYLLTITRATSSQGNILHRNGRTKNPSTALPDCRSFNSFNEIPTRFAPPLPSFLILCKLRLSTIRSEGFGLPPSLDSSPTLGRYSDRGIVFGPQRCLSAFRFFHYFCEDPLRYFTLFSHQNQKNGLLQRMNLSNIRALSKLPMPSICQLTTSRLFSPSKLWPKKR